MPVERALICPPRCRIGAITRDERAVVRARSPLGDRYDSAVNRESAYEILSRRVAPAEGPAAGRETGDARGAVPTPGGEETQAGRGGGIGELLWGTKRRQGMVETMAKQAARTVGSRIGGRIVRGILGGILGGTRRR